MTKRCGRCSENKAVAEFGPSKQHSGGLRSYCRTCHTESEKARRKRCREIVCAQEKERRQRNLERYIERERVNSARYRRRKGLEFFRERTTQRLMLLHRGRAAVSTCVICGVIWCPTFGRQAFAFKTCGDSCLHELARRRRAKKNATRRARKKGAHTESFNPIDVLKRDGWRCQACGCDTPRKLRGKMHPKAPHLDHIHPLSMGGDHSMENTQCLCMRCNLSKGKKLDWQIAA